MNSLRSTTAGETRSCPHCQETILKSSTICPACQHHLQFGAIRKGTSSVFYPLHIEGKIEQPSGEKPSEYTVVVEIHGHCGEVISRRVLAVGTLLARQARTFSIRVEVSSPDKSSL